MKNPFSHAVKITPASAPTLWFVGYHLRHICQVNIIRFCFINHYQGSVHPVCKWDQGPCICENKHRNDQIVNNKNTMKAIKSPKCCFKS